jgi:hypothetical protein
MERFDIEHWRDGERLEKFTLSPTMIHCDGPVASIVIPAGLFELATTDEIRFNRDGLIEVLILCRPNTNER